MSMQQTIKLVVLAGMLAATPLLTDRALGQTLGQTAGLSADAASNPTSVPGCPRPAEAKDAKVIEFDTVSSIAKLAVNLGSGRFKLVKIKAWDRPDDPRPLIPVIDAARIMQGNIHFYTPNLNSDPESTHDSFLLMTEMGGGFVCWATPASLISEGSYPVADEGAAAPNAAASGGSPASAALGRARGRGTGGAGPQ
jgi:hypothetical protein